MSSMSDDCLNEIANGIGSNEEIYTIQKSLSQMTDSLESVSETIAEFLCEQPGIRDRAALAILDYCVRQSDPIYGPKMAFEIADQFMVARTKLNIIAQKVTVAPVKVEIKAACEHDGCNLTAEPNLRYCRGHEGGFGGDFKGRTEKENGK